MKYDVIIEQQNGVYRALIPALPHLSAEGATRDEAIRNAQQAAQVYLAKVEVTTIDVETPQTQAFNRRSPQNWIKSAGMFVGDEEAMLQHIEEIYAERRRQREEAEREADLSDSE